MRNKQLSPTFLTRYGPWALITGASSGIGAEFAQQLAALGFKLILSARSTDKLYSLAKQLAAQYSIEVQVLTLDLGDKDFMNSIKQHTAEHETGLLINSAGFALTGPLLDNSINAEQQLLAVNCHAPLVLSHYFAHKMKPRKKGGIIFLSSIVAFSAVPQWANYAASKAYNLVLAESLHSELKPLGIDVLALSPGPTATGFQHNAGVRDFMTMDVQQVVHQALTDLGHKAISIPGALNRYNNFWVKIFPRALNRKIFAAIINKVRL